MLKTNFNFARIIYKENNKQSKYMETISNNLSAEYINKLQEENKYLYNNVHNFVHSLEDYRSKMKPHQRVIRYFSNIFDAIFNPDNVVSEMDVVICSSEILYKNIKSAK